MSFCVDMKLVLYRMRQDLWKKFKDAFREKSGEKIFQTANQLDSDWEQAMGDRGFRLRLE